MEDLTLALITLTSFVLLFVVAIFADRAGATMDPEVLAEPVRISVEPDRPMTRVDADVA